MKRIGYAVVSICSVFASVELLAKSGAKFECLNDYVGENHPCEIGQPYSADISEPTSSATIPTRPSYFMKVEPGTDAVFLIGENGNLRLDTRTGTTEVVPGSIDPVPTPDGRYVSVPENGNLRLYRRKEDGSYRPVFVEETMKSEYQSFSVTSEDSQYVRYRMIANHHEEEDEDLPPGTTDPYAAPETGLYFWDFEASKSDPDQVKRVKRGALCANLQGHFKLPMLAKDGNLISLFDTRAGVTKIYEIRENFCYEKFNLGFPTGKVEFNAKGTKITFHASSAYVDRNDGARYFRNPTANHGMNVFVYDLGTKQVTPVTNNHGGQSYYPVFKNDDEVTFLHTDRDRAVNLNQLKGKKPPSPYFVRTARFDRRRGASLESLRGDCPNLPEIDSAGTIVALGKLWAQACLNTPIRLVEDDLDTQAYASVGELTSATAAFFKGLSLDAKECRVMVDRCWNELRTAIQAGGGAPFDWRRTVGGRVRPVNGGEKSWEETTRTTDILASDFGHERKVKKKPKNYALPENPGGDLPEEGIDYEQRREGGVFGEQIRPPRDYSHLKREDLEAVCPGEPLGTTKFKPVETKEKVISPYSAFRKLSKRFCVSCHEEGKIPFDNPEKLKTELAASGRPWVEEIERRLTSHDAGRMPPEGRPAPDPSLLKNSLKYLRVLNPGATSLAQPHDPF